MMALFIIGIAILAVGGFFYERLVEKIFAPDDREPPARRLFDGIDYKERSKREMLGVELSNIAGIGPILGGIQGILFGPVAFLTIPIVSILAGATHDYFIGMISMRNGGHQLPRLIGGYMGKGAGRIYNAVLAVFLILAGAIFIYAPGDLIAGDLLGVGIDGSAVWIVYGAILIYYVAAILAPIGRIAEKIHLIFGGILLLSTLAIFIGIFAAGGDLFTTYGGALLSEHPAELPFLPTFFVVVSYGILSGAHGFRISAIARTARSEFQGGRIFYRDMLIEGAVAMIWAAGAMIAFRRGIALDTEPTLMIGEVSRELSGNIIGLLALLSAIILPIVAGNTTFHSLRLIVADGFDFDQSTTANRLLLALILFIPTVLILFFAKSNADGFQMLWRLFGLANHLIALFAFALISVYLKIHGKNNLLALFPGIFYAFIASSYLLENLLRLPPRLALIGGIVFAASFAAGVEKIARKRGKRKRKN